jgi:hypothetical protein
MSRQIFRQVALERYSENLTKTVLPRFASPPWTFVFSALGMLLLALLAVFWTLQMPVYATGPGVVLYRPETAPLMVSEVASISPRYPGVVVQRPLGGFSGGEIRIAAFLSPEYAARVSPGQPAIIHFSGRESGEPSFVTAVEPAIASPASIRTRYNLDATAGQLVIGPAFVALIRTDALTEEMVGSIGEIRILVSTQRSAAFLPWIGRFFKQDNNVPR